MLLTSLFSNLSDRTVKDTLGKYNVVVPDRFEFEKLNIVIGANGAGKTRFLRALEELYHLDNQKAVLYGYLPALSDRKIQNIEHDHNLPESTLFESMYMDNVTFSDFFKEIEAHNEEFIPEILAFRSQRRDNALHMVVEYFKELTGKTLIIKNKTTYILNADGSLTSLSQALMLLSPGELMLFYMSIFLTIQENKKKNKVIILDEPECHLHPKALLSFIKLLTATGNFSEIWIATHSLYIIPEFGFENIVHMSNSNIQKRTSTVYQNIYTSLLGDPDGKVRAYFASLSQWQYCEFIAECFTDPTVVDIVNPADEQVLLFIQYLERFRPLRVLDCGGGSGRLGLSLDAAQIGDAGNISYEIYDINPTYSGTRFPVITNLNDAKGPYNCVIMMNFLHEVEPQEWEKLFHDLFELMESEAYLFFVEVTALSQGEMPNSQGYFVLGKEELEILFCCSQGMFEIKSKENQKSSCILIPRSYLKNVNRTTVHKAIIHLRDRMLNEIKLLREAANEDKRQISSTRARHYAFLSQQYLNAKLYIDSTRDVLNPYTKEELWRKDQILSETISIIEHVRDNSPFWSHNELYNKIKIAAKYREAKQAVPPDILTSCWHQVLHLERIHAEKTLIAAFLLALALMGDKRSKNRLISNGYDRFLPPKYGVYCKEEF